MANIRQLSTLEDLEKMYKTNFPYCLVGSITQASLAFESLLLEVGYADLDDPWKYKSNYKLAGFIDFMVDYSHAKMVLSSVQDDWYAF